MTRSSNKIIYKKQKITIFESPPQFENGNNLYSIYNYRKTKGLNESYNNSRELFNGKKKGFNAYIGFTDNMNDIFYIVNDRIVVYQGTN